MTGHTLLVGKGATEPFPPQDTPPWPIELKIQAGDGVLS